MNFVVYSTRERLAMWSAGMGICHVAELKTGEDLIREIAKDTADTLASFTVFFTDPYSISHVGQLMRMLLDVSRQRSKSDGT